MTATRLLHRTAKSYQISIRRNLSFVLVPWRHAIVESHGDYERDAAILEPPYDSDTVPPPPLYRYQRDLPRLPVPSLQDTIDRFLPTALPLAESPEEEESLRQACRDYLHQAQHLQERLLEKAAASRSTSWLQQWWNTLGYLQFRDPVVINVSYFFNLPDDPTLSTGTSSREQDPQIQRGALVLKAAWEYRQMVASGTLPQETIGKAKTPLCSVGFKYLFHSCRIPNMGQDSYKLYDPSIYTHAVVACRGHFFVLPLVDDCGQEYPLQALEVALRQCQKLAHQQRLQAAPTTKHGTPPPPLDEGDMWLQELGYLTTSHRDACATARDALLCIPGMDEALPLLESGMLLLCLDDEMPYSMQQRARHYWHGNGSSNRWYDKNIQLIVTKQGALGYVGEHSMMDGMPAVGLCRHLAGRTYRQWRDEASTHTSLLSPSTPVVRNIFEPILKTLSNESRMPLKELVLDAKSNFLDMVDSFDMHVQSFRGYGTTFIKSAGFSPDAFVQMAMQLATFRLFGRPAATYESTQVRPMLHGRTETTRTVSPASLAFCHAMEHGGAANDKHYNHADTTMRQMHASKKLNLLKEATESHVKYSRLASQAQGVDRHFMGLALVAKEGEEMPALHSHPLYVRSKIWRVSTSTLPGVAPGFGPVCDTGVGIGYDAQPNSCIFSVSSLKRYGWTEPLCHYLEEALLDMRELIELESMSRSKL
jgi:carnitine O-acetyltransferase